MLPAYRRFGAHMSIAGGLHRAFDAAAKSGCDCMQIFVKNQQQWTARPLSQERISLFGEAWRRTRVRPVIAHAGYLPNIASPNAQSRERSMAAIVDELTRCEALGIGDLVLHPGAHLGAGIDDGIRNVIASLDEIHRRTAGFRVKLLLETTAGQGTSVGHVFWQIGRIIDGVAAPQRVGVCLDTCHLFAAGYDLADGEDFARTMAELRRYVGFRRVRCIHVNDSKTPCDGRVDRHENIGQGKMGRRAFVNVIHDPRLARAAMILETPKGYDARGRDLDRVNLARLRRIAMAFHA